MASILIFIIDRTVDPSLGHGTAGCLAPLRYHESGLLPRPAAPPAFRFEPRSRRGQSSDQRRRPPSPTSCSPDRGGLAAAGPALKCTVRPWHHQLEFQIPDSESPLHSLLVSNELLLCIHFVI